MDPNTPLPVFTFVYGSPEAQHVTAIKFADEEMAKDYAARKLKEHNRESGWTTVAVGRGHGGDVEFFGAWDIADGALTWTADE